MPLPCQASLAALQSCPSLGRPSQRQWTTDCLTAYTQSLVRTHGSNARTAQSLLKPTTDDWTGGHLARTVETWRWQHGGHHMPTAPCPYPARGSLLLVTRLHTRTSAARTHKCSLLLCSDYSLDRAPRVRQGVDVRMVEKRHAMQAAADVKALRAACDIHADYPRVELVLGLLGWRKAHVWTASQVSICLRWLLWLEGARPDSYPNYGFKARGARKKEADLKAEPPSATPRGAGKGKSPRHRSSRESGESEGERSGGGAEASFNNSSSIASPLASPRKSTRRGPRPPVRSMPVEECDKVRAGQFS